MRPTSAWGHSASTTTRPYTEHRRCDPIPRLHVPFGSDKVLRLEEEEGVRPVFDVVWRGHEHRSSIRGRDGAGLAKLGGQCEDGGCRPVLRPHGQLPHPLGSCAREEAQGRGPTGLQRTLQSGWFRNWLSRMQYHPVRARTHHGHSVAAAHRCAGWRADHQPMLARDRLAFHSRAEEHVVEPYRSCRTP